MFYFVCAQFSSIAFFCKIPVQMFVVAFTVSAVRDLEQSMQYYVIIKFVSDLRYVVLYPDTQISGSTNKTDHHNIA